VVTLDRGHSAAGSQTGSVARPTGKAASLAIVLAVWVATSAAGLGSLSLAEPDEPRFAEATRQMFARGDFLTPFFNGAPRFEKPILFYWMQAIAFAALGPTETAARLPASLAGLGCLLITWAMGRRAFGPTAGLAAAVILATTFRFAIWTRQGLTDVPVLFFMMAALYAWLRAFEGDDREGRIALVGWAAVGLAALTKGPVAVLPVLVTAVFLLVTRQWHLLRRWHLPAGTLVAALVVLPWYGWMTWLHGREFVDFALGYEVLARYGYSGAAFPSANRSFLWYAAIYPGDAAPWTLFIAAGAVFAAWRFRRGDIVERQAVIFFAMWFVTVFAVFASARFKVPHYVLPAYPAASIIAGYLIDRVIRGQTSAAFWRVPFVLTTTALAAMTVIVALFLRRAFLTPWVSVGMAAPALLGAALIAAWIAAAAGRRGRAFSAIVGGVSLATASLALVTAPRELQRYQPIRALGQRLAALADADDRVGLYGRLGGPGVIFYSRHNITWIDSVEEALDFLNARDRRFLVIPEDDFAAVAARQPGPLFVIDRGTFFNVRLKRLFESRLDTADRPMLLVANQPVSPKDIVE